ncbi:MAG: GNAT family N-acetyltransferase [Clostridia bacterium]
MNRKKIKENLELKTLKMEHLSQFNELLRYAFQVTSKELMNVGWNVDEIRQAKSPILKKADVIGWFDNEKLVSQVAVYPMKINMHGKIYNMGGMTGVATYPEYANFGLMKKLISTALVSMKERGQTISYLYPYSIPYYRRKGWEIISDKMTFVVKDYQLPKYVEVPGMVERVPVEAEDFENVYNEFAKTRHGALIRDNLAWEEYFRWDTDDIIGAIYYNENKEPMGYLCYYIENEIFHVKEMVFLNEEARNGMWNYISAHFSMVKEVRGANYTSEPLAFFLDDGEIEEKIRPYYMGRIVDLENFIKDYPFALCPKDLKINFIIKDPLMECNNGDFSLSFDDNEDTVFKKEKDGEPCEIDIQTLTTMLLSYKRPTYLRRIGRIKASDKVIKMLEKMIPQETAYFSDYF